MLSRETGAGMDSGANRRGRQNDEGGTKRQATPRLAPACRSEGGRSHPDALKGRMNLERGARSQTSPPDDVWCGGQGVGSRLGRTAFGSGEDSDSSVRDAAAFGSRRSSEAAAFGQRWSEHASRTLRERGSPRGEFSGLNFSPGSSLGEDGEDRVERPRSRSEERNQNRCYPRMCRPCRKNPTP